MPLLVSDIVAVVAAGAEDVQGERVLRRPQLGEGRFHFAHRGAQVVEGLLEVSGAHAICSTEQFRAGWSMFSLVGQWRRGIGGRAGRWGEVACPRGRLLWPQSNLLGPLIYLLRPLINLLRPLIYLLRPLIY